MERWRWWEVERKGGVGEMKVGGGGGRWREKEELER